MKVGFVIIIIAGLVKVGFVIIIIAGLVFCQLLQKQKKNNRIY